MRQLNQHAERNTPRHVRFADAESESSEDEDTTQEEEQNETQEIRAGGAQPEA